MNKECPLPGGNKKECIDCSYYKDNICILLLNKNNTIIRCIGNCQECLEINCTMHPFNIKKTKKKICILKRLKKKFTKRKLK